MSAETSKHTDKSQTSGSAGMSGVSAMPGMPGMIDELEILQEQVTNTQIKLKAALNRYEELYHFSEEISKNSEQQAKNLSEKITTLETALEISGQKLTAETAAFSQKSSEFQKAIELKNEEIRTLKEHEAAILNNSFKMGRAIGKNIQSLEDLSGFIESFLKQLDSSSGDSLAPKGARIMLEQLRSEIDSLKTLRNHLGVGN